MDQRHESGDVEQSQVEGDQTGLDATSEVPRPVLSAGSSLFDKPHPPDIESTQARTVLKEVQRTGLERLSGYQEDSYIDVEQLGSLTVVLFGRPEWDRLAEDAGLSETETTYASRAHTNAFVDIHDSRGTQPTARRAIFKYLPLIIRA